MSQVTLCGSQCEFPHGSEFAAHVASDEIIQITCILRRGGDSLPHAEARVSHQQLERQWGADPADAEAVERFAATHGFSVVKVDHAARAVTLSGAVQELSKAFGATVELRKMDGHVFRARQGEITLHPTLQDCVVGVLGFDNRPLAKPRFQMTPDATRHVAYTPIQVAKAYNFPTNKGANQTIALIELGGGFRNADLTAYWKQVGVPPVKTTAVGVDGATNKPVGDPDSADGEVTLDIQVAGAIAPSARLAVYFAPNTEQGFYNAISAAIHDKVRKPSVISISWGSPEDTWTPQALNSFNALFHDAALLGVSVCAASGDSGSSDGEIDGRDHADFPASSPWVLACGGTRLQLTGGAITSEVVWNAGRGAAGGGVSRHFSKPAYQSAVNVPAPTGTANSTGRGVPDVAGNADPATGYVVLVDGEAGVVGGTSAVAPLWAALIALLNERLGKRVGWMHPKLYGVLSQNKALNDITSGSNGSYDARTGWDPCTGLGTPDGEAILKLLQS